MTQVTTEELTRARPGSIDTEALAFSGLRGDPRRHLTRAALVEALAALPPAPKDRGTLELMVARGPAGERHLPPRVLLTVQGGMPGDRWASQTKYGVDYQLSTTRSDFAKVIANGQPLQLHGDNLYLHLDLSTHNLPPGSLLRMGDALLSVTPQAHNGCKKWVQRFGLDAMQLNLAAEYRDVHLRGIYLRVVEAGWVRVADPVVVEARSANAG